MKTTLWLSMALLSGLLGACASTGSSVVPAQLDSCRDHLSDGEYADAERRCEAVLAGIEGDAVALQANVRQLSNLASSAIRFGDYRMAERIAVLAVPNDGGALAILARAKGYQGDYTAAIERGSEYLDRYGMAGPLALDAIDAVTSAWVTLERFDEAQRMVQIAKAIAEASVDSYASVRAKSLEASLLWALGEKQASGALASQALTLAVQSGLDASALLNQIARLKAVEGKYDEAHALLEKSLGIAHVRPWPGHPEYAKAMNDLGLVDYLAGRYDDAETKYLLALKVRRERLGPDHTLVAQTLINLGALYHRLGDLDQAAALYEKALDINAAVLGKDSRRTQLIFENLDMLGQDRRRSADAPREPHVDGP